MSRTTAQVKLGVWLCLRHGRERDAAYDGKTKRGPWAYMCEECFADQGIGLGLGLGQRLEVRS